tara:strand:+ start:82 stop:381 length:300 start_codon:yes stop_codon:yes gene_type:complete
MFKTRVLNLDKVLTSVEQSIKKVNTSLVNTLLVEAKKSTPIRQGRARRGWRVERQGTNTRVVNRVPYIGTLERGRSKQAPRGILRPTVQKMKNRRKLHE